MVVAMWLSFLWLSHVDIISGFSSKTLGLVRAKGKKTVTHMCVGLDVTVAQPQKCSGKPFCNNCHREIPIAKRYKSAPGSEKSSPYVLRSAL